MQDCPGVDTQRLQESFGAVGTRINDLSVILDAILFTCQDARETTIELFDAARWRARSFAEAISAVEKIPQSVYDHLYLLPVDAHRSALTPVVIAERGRDAHARSADLESAALLATGVLHDVRTAVWECKEWCDVVLTKEMPANRVVTQALKYVDTPEAAVDIGASLWRWCEGDSALAQATPDLLRRAASHAVPSETAEPDGLWRVCAGIVGRLGEARAAGKAEFGKARAACAGS